MELNKFQVIKREFPLFKEKSIKQDFFKCLLTKEELSYKES